MSQSTWRFQLRNGEILNTLDIPHKALTVHILTGEAWVSHNGQDIVLHSGESLAVNQDEEAAIISTPHFGDTPTLTTLIFEVARSA
ncbi:MAG TPA: DUF2917 domain-containing protein [Aggregatilineales bacterium]|nr:hypothetical protein [Anaerolineales bacterium]HRE46092.1 DUF2917 domain-containing protein [Aggregatilineales bacterium]